MNRAVFLDRDGTLIKDMHYLNDPDKVQLLPNVINSLKILQDAGFLLVIISNQSGVGRGYFPESRVKRVNQRLMDILKKDGVSIGGSYYAPHFWDSKIKKYRQGANLRKPNPGMLLKAEKGLNIELSASYMIGDMESDVGVGINAGVKKTVLIKGEYDYSKKEYIADKEVNSLFAGVNWILKQEEKSGIITNKKQLQSLVKKLKKAKKRIITTNGAFDLLHIGHLRYLHECRSRGDVLIIGLNSDKSVKEYKSNKRPIIHQNARAEMLVNLKPVDYVFIFNEPDPREFVKIVKPVLHIKAGDYTMSQIIEKRAVESNGGKVELIKFLNGSSTSGIIEKIKKL